MLSKIVINTLDHSFWPFTQLMATVDVSLMAVDNLITENFPSKLPNAHFQHY